MFSRASIGVVAVAVVLTGAACSSATEAGDGPELNASGPQGPRDTTTTPPGSQPRAGATLDVEGPLGRVDRDYVFDLRQKDTTAQARTYHLASGDLPAGVTLAQDGTLRGKPTASGVHKSVVYGEGPCGDASCRLEVRLSISVPNVVLLSGFGPFAGVPVNPSWQAVEPLNDAMIAGYDVRVIQVPVIWDEAVPKYFDAYSRLHPAMALASGVAMGETGVRLETTARNQAAGADVADRVWPSGKIDSSGPSTFKTGLPVNLLIETLKQAKYPTVLSDNAGDYLCNFLFYGLMKKLSEEKADPHVVAGFVHVPGPEVVAPADMTEAWKLMITRLAAYRDQLVASAGPSQTASAGADLMLPIVHTPPRY